jgi:hypothetical protein
MADVIAAMSHQPTTLQDVRISRGDRRPSFRAVYAERRCLVCWKVGGSGSAGAVAASARLWGDPVHSVTIPRPGLQLPLMEPMSTMGGSCLWDDYRTTPDISSSNHVSASSRSSHAEACRSPAG